MQQENSAVQVMFQGGQETKSIEICRLKTVGIRSATGTTRGGGAEGLQRLAELQADLLALWSMR